MTEVPVKPGTFTPGRHAEAVLDRMFEELVEPTGALRALRLGR